MAAYIDIMDWEYYLLFVLVLAQMLRTNLTLAQITAHLGTLSDREAIVIIPVGVDDVNTEDISKAPSGSLVDLVREWTLVKLVGKCQKPKTLDKMIEFPVHNIYISRHPYISLGSMVYILQRD